MSIRDAYLACLRPSTLAAIVADIDSTLEDKPMTLSEDCLRTMIYGVLCESQGQEQADKLISLEVHERNE